MGAKRTALVKKGSSGFQGDKKSTAEANALTRSASNICGQTVVTKSPMLLICVVEDAAVTISSAADAASKSPPNKFRDLLDNDEYDRHGVSDGADVEDDVVVVVVGVVMGSFRSVLMTRLCWGRKAKIGRESPISNNTSNNAFRIVVVMADTVLDILCRRKLSLDNW
jgi:hypothetical protein